MIDPFTAGAAINAGTSLITNAVNSYSVKKQNEMAMANWREANEYNTPRRQRERLEQAGLAPQLMFGSSGMGGQAAPAPKIERPNMDFSQVGSIISTYLDLKAKDTQIENTRQDTALKTNQTENVRLDTVPKMQVNDADMSKRWSEENDKTVFTPQFRTYMYSLENQQKEGTRIDSTIRNLDQSTLNKDQELKISKLMEFVPIGQRKQYEKLGILPTDDGDIQTIKVLYNLFTGEKMDETNSKSPAIGGILNMLKMFKGNTSVSSGDKALIRHVRKNFPTLSNRFH